MRICLLTHENEDAMEVKKIYFDMDGVLADFAGGVRELCGMEPVSQTMTDLKKLGIIKE